MALTEAALSLERLKHRARLILSADSGADLLEQLETALAHSSDGEASELLRQLRLQRREKQQQQQQQQQQHRSLPQRQEEEKSSKLQPHDKAVLTEEEPQSAATAAAGKIQQLMLLQKDLSAQAIETERQNHAILAAEVASLTSVLKEATLQMHRSVLEQNVQLESLQTVAAKNQAELDKQSKKTKEAAQTMTTSVWATIGTIVWLVSWFVITYGVIRFFPKPK
jgi:hypothetical protein